MHFHIKINQLMEAETISGYNRDNILALRLVHYLLVVLILAIPPVAEPSSYHWFHHTVLAIAAGASVFDKRVINSFKMPQTRGF